MWFVVGGTKKKKKKKGAGDQMTGLLPISSPGSRHSWWCRDRDGVACPWQACMRSRQGSSARDNANARPRH